MIQLHYILHPTAGEGPNIIYLNNEAQKLLQHNRGANLKKRKMGGKEN